MSRTYKPAITVAAIVERDQRFLMVEEETSEGLRLNQPAGHLEPNESIIDAVIRETLEETAHPFTPEYLVGVYLWPLASDLTSSHYLRFAISGQVGAPLAKKLDTGIVRSLWLSYAEIQEQSVVHRSPMVLRCLEDYLRGQRTSLSLLEVI